MPRSMEDIIKEALDEQLLYERQTRESMGNTMYDPSGPMAGIPGNMTPPSMMADPRVMDDLAFNPTPLTRNTPPPASPLDRVNPAERYDDSKTRGQRGRDSDVMTGAYIYGQTPMINPHHYNNPPGMEESPDPPGMQMMPAPGLPKYPMQVMPPSDQSPEMSQLLQFYSEENI